MDTVKGLARSYNGLFRPIFSAFQWSQLITNASNNQCDNDLNTKQ